MDSNGSLYRRCSCQDTTNGTQLGAACPRLANPGHGSWYFAIEIPAYPDGYERYRVRRGGYPTRAAALAELRRPNVRSGQSVTMSTGAWLRTWIDSRTTLAPISREGYEIHIRLYLEPMLEWGDPTIASYDTAAANMTPEVGHGLRTANIRAAMHTTEPRHTPPRK